MTASGSSWSDACWPTRSASRSTPNWSCPGRWRLDDAVGVEQHTVTRFEGLGRHRRGSRRVRKLPEAPRQRGRTFQLLDDLSAADEHRQGMPRVGPGHRAGVEIDARELTGGECDVWKHVGGCERQDGRASARDRCSRGGRGGSTRHRARR